MAIAVDNTSSIVSIVNQSAGGNTTGSFTVGSITNGLLVFGISAWNNGGTGTGLSALTYNGVAATKISSTGLANGAFYTEMWALVAPATGSNTVSATVTGKTDKLGIGISSWSGCDQTTGVDVATSASGTSGTVTASVTTTTASEYLVDCVSHLSANNPTSGTGTQIYSSATSGTSTVAQYTAAPTAGSNSMTWSYPDPGDAWSYSVMAIKPAGGGPPPAATITYMPYMAPFLS